MDDQNGFISQILFSKLHKIIVNKVAFVGFRGGDRPPPWIRSGGLRGVRTVQPHRARKFRGPALNQFTRFIIRVRP